MKIFIDLQCLKCQKKFHKYITVSLLYDLLDKINNFKCPQCKEGDSCMFQVNNIQRIENEQ